MALLSKLLILFFNDVKSGDWFYDAVRYVNKHELFKGVSDTEFAPNSSLTRAQAATLLLRITKMPKPTSTPIPTVFPSPTASATTAPISSVDLDLDFLKLEENKKNFYKFIVCITFFLKLCTLFYCF